MRLNRYIVDFGERPEFVYGGKITSFYRAIEVVDAFSRSEVKRQVRCKSSQIVFMRCLGN
jgi:hypothetical protein